MADTKITNETKKLSKEYLEECPYLHNIKKTRSEWVEIWDNFCPRGESVSLFVPDTTNDNNEEISE